MFLLKSLVVAALGIASAAPMPLKYSEQCILETIANKKNITLRPEVPAPALYLESVTPLKQFQDAIEPQWNFRPDVFTNAFIVARNEIYLIDDEKYYQDHDRFIDDSLAHELTHFLQVRYQNADLNNDDSLEADAVDAQTWFREQFMLTGKNPCSN